MDKYSEERYPLSKPLVAKVKDWLRKQQQEAIVKLPQRSAQENYQNSAALKRVID